MHRKKVRRWHKLLSVSGIIVAVFGMFYLPTANAQPGGPTPDGLYGPTFSKGNDQMWFLDLPQNVVGLQSSDLYVTGTATNCVIDNIPNIVGFSFGFWVRGCSDGKYRVNLKAESIAHQNGITGPTADYMGAETVIDRSQLTTEFKNVPASVNQKSMVWQLHVNHPMVYIPTYDFSIGGVGCYLTSTTPTTYGLDIAVDGCLSGASAAVTVNANSIQDKFGNNGPIAALISPIVQVSYASVSVTPTETPLPTPSPSSSPTPTSSPTASPTPTPADTPTTTPTPSDTPASVAVAIPPTEPPSAPAPPAVQDQTPVVAPVLEVAPITVEPEPVLESPVESLSPITVVRSKIVQVRNSIAAPKPVEPLVEETQIQVEPPAQVITPAIETTARPSFNWQPIGYLAIAVGGAAAAVGGALMLQRMMKVRRLRFS